LTSLYHQVIEYCRYHYEAKRLDQSEEDIERWNKDFMKVDNKTLFNILIVSSSAFCVLCPGDS